MRDVTNYLPNLGRELEQMKFQVSLTYMELSVLKALAQNPHYMYQGSEELMMVAKQMFEEAKHMMEYSERRRAKIPIKESDVTKLINYIDDGDWF